MQTAAIGLDGELFIWGRGGEGQLGLGSGRTRSVQPVRVLPAQFGPGAPARAVEVQCGYKHTAVIAENAERPEERGIYTAGLGNFEIEGVQGFAGTAGIVGGDGGAVVGCLATGKYHTAVLTLTGELLTIGHRCVSESSA